MEAWPLDRTKRSRPGQCGFRGLKRRKRSQITNARGASAIGVPGWPLFAFCTASIESVRTVLMQSCSKSTCTGIWAWLLTEGYLSLCGYKPPSQTIDAESNIRLPEHLPVDKD